MSARPKPSTHRSQPSATVLIADDQADVLDALRLLLKNEGYRIEAAISPKAVLASIEDREFDSVIIDLNYARDTTSGQEGLDLLDQIRRIDSRLPVIVMTAWGTIELAVEAMRRGARDFIQKPWENPRLLAIVRTQVEFCRMLRSQERLEAENRLLRAEGHPTMIAESAAMQPVLQMIAKVAPSDANILITGEHGTGKEVIAKTIHALSDRSGNPMVTLNIGSLADGVFESELFGHVRGAFTDAKSDRVGRFEMADGGTLFLDEIANLGATQQSRLLRILESGELERVGSSRTVQVNVRILSATNAELDDAVKAGHFRADLLFRLNTIEIRLPPLRDRPEDIVPLAMHFLATYRSRYEKNVRSFNTDAVTMLTRHPWPGNVRELDHAVERAVLMASGDEVNGADLGLHNSGDSTSTLEDMSIEDVEAFLIQKCLVRHGGNVSQAAKALGLSRSALYRRIERYRIQ